MYIYWKHSILENIMKSPAQMDWEFNYSVIDITVLSELETQQQKYPSGSSLTDLYQLWLQPDAISSMSPKHPKMLQYPYYCRDIYF